MSDTITEKNHTDGNAENYEQPNKSEIALKLARFANGNPPNWEGFIEWVNDAIDAAKTAGYNEGFADGDTDTQ